ncbi:type II RES/Xre toxin-antitoxin system antitoxin [Geoalkalibacter sp.]|uniref:type II RES/Xre toxin-antitoxin system antitoxin n=1 Tax=Geoalkalibacter sp. TaxID=3041440 RepID=UPI00272EBCAB|nr:antitoxin Xre-like helix-turn-helix domain-containing protein [Geoalkalibacter sp.]
MNLAEVLHQQPTLKSLAQAARHGVPRKFIDELADVLGISLRDLAPLVHASERNLRRYQPEQLLPPDVSDRVLNIARVLERAVDVLDTPERAVQWLKHDNRALGEVPLKLLGSTFGAEQVLSILGRIEQGVFS